MRYEAEIVVCGAGTAGSVAAIAAADAGRDVIVIEQFGAAGGSGTLALVTPLMNTCVPGNPMGSYVSREINRRMVALGAAAGKGDSWFDPEMLKIVLNEMLVERGVRVLYHTFLIGARREGGKVTSVEIVNKSGRGEVAGKIFIDATGDADVVHALGFETLHGSEEDGKNQPMSLRYLLGGVNTQAFWDYLERVTHPDDAPRPRPENYDGAVTLNPEKQWPLKPLFLQAIDDGLLTREDALYWQFFTVPGRRDAIAFNCPEFFDFHDADDAENQSRVQAEGKRAILRQLSFYRARIPGFEHAYLSEISAMVGVRESRRAVTDHILTAGEILGRARFDDAVCRCNYPVDVHGRDLNTYALSGNDREPYYEIPLRCLIVRDAENLLVAGRNLGSEFIAQSSARIIPTCRAMGEAAGLAAALSIRDQKPVREIGGKHVREEMSRMGADEA